MQSISPTVFILGVDKGLRYSLFNLFLSVGLVTEEMENTESFLSSNRWQDLGCVLSDFRLPKMNALELQRQLQMRGSRIPMVIIIDSNDVDSAVQAVKQGALDILEKPIKEQLLLNSIFRAVNQALILWERQKQTEAARRRLSHLTPREKQVLDLILAGTLNKVIAGELGISIKTVEAHRHNVMRKTETKKLPELMDLVATARREDVYCLHGSEEAGLINSLHEGMMWDGHSPKDKLAYP